MNDNKVIIYTTDEGKTKIDVRLEEETLWLTQAQMCELYQASKSDVSEHIKHIFEDGELAKDSTVRKSEQLSRMAKSGAKSHSLVNLKVAFPYGQRTLFQPSQPTPNRELSSLLE